MYLGKCQEWNAASERVNHCRQGEEIYDEVVSRERDRHCLIGRSWCWIIYISSLTNQKTTHRNGISIIYANSIAQKLECRTKIYCLFSHPIA